MPDPINIAADDVPVYFQALLNIIGFLIAAAAMWYAYFVKGKSNVQTGTDVPWFDLKVFRKIGDDISRMADSVEKTYILMKHEADEDEIRRRVNEELGRRRKE